MNKYMTYNDAATVFTQYAAAIKQRIIQYTTMPTTKSTDKGRIVQYIGETSGGYTKGFFYECVEDTSVTPFTYEWKEISAQDISAKQNKTLDTPITVDGTSKTTVESALDGINTLAASNKTNKADKVASATADNFASLDANGNLKDSGHKHSDYKTQQTAVSDPTASGNGITFIDTISQNANGEITPTKRTVSTLTGANASNNGAVGLVPQPVAGDEGKFLRGDATWSTLGTNPMTGYSKPSSTSAIATNDTLNEAIGKLEKGIEVAIDNLDVTGDSNIAASKTIKSWSETDGKVSITTQDIAIASSQISGLGTASSKDVAATGDASATQVVLGNDSRLTDARQASDVSAWAKASTKPSYTASEVGAIATSAKGAASGVAELDANGKVPSAQLPSYVDDVIEGYLYNGKFYKESTHTTEIVGETGKIYVSLDTDKTYRWSGSAFVVISETIALGETSSTAYYGDKGKTAYDHSQSTHARTDATAVSSSSTNGNIKINGTETTVYTHPGSGTNPHGTTASDVGLGNVGNFKAVSTAASQGLSATEQSNARANINAQVAGSYATSTQGGKADTAVQKIKLGSETTEYSGTTTTLPTVSSTSAGVAPKGKAVTTQSQTTKFLREDGTWAAPSYTTSPGSIGNGTLTIQKNGTNVQTFTANQSTNATANITVPTKTSDLTNDSGFINAVDSALSSTSTNPVQNKVINSALSGKSDTGHTHNYAGSSSAGGVATNAARLSNTTKIGDTNKPVYFNASGVPVAISYEVNKTVPSDAVFTDTWRPVGTGATDCAAGNHNHDTAYQPKGDYVSSVKVGTTSYSPSSGVVSLPAYPTTLPASDVSAWAKASTKPSYTASEVGAVDKTGDTMTGQLTIQKSSGDIGILITNDQGAVYMAMDSGEPTIGSGMARGLAIVSGDSRYYVPVIDSYTDNIIVGKYISSSHGELKLGPQGIGFGGYETLSSYEEWISNGGVCTSNKQLYFLAPSTDVTYTTSDPPGFGIGINYGYNYGMIIPLKNSQDSAATADNFGMKPATVVGQLGFGSSSLYWGNIYATSFEKVSDKKKKKNIQLLNSNKSYEKLFDEINFVKFQWKDNYNICRPSSSRFHYGVIAQDFEDLSHKNNISNKDNGIIQAGFYLDSRAIEANYVSEETNKEITNNLLSLTDGTEERSNIGYLMIEKTKLKDDLDSNLNINSIYLIDKNGESTEIKLSLENDVAWYAQDDEDFSIPLSNINDNEDKSITVNFLDNEEDFNLRHIIKFESNFNINDYEEIVLNIDYLGEYKFYLLPEENYETANIFDVERVGNKLIWDYTLDYTELTMMSLSVLQETKKKHEQEIAKMQNTINELIEVVNNLSEEIQQLKN